MCCSLGCYNIYRGYVKPAIAPRVCALPECEIVFVPAEAKTRCCSERHGKTLYNREYRAAGRAQEPWTDRRRENYHRRIARKKGVTVGETVRMESIAARDGWVCQLCSKRVPQDKPWPHPLSPSLDHIIPLSREGSTHEPANVQLAHLRCNTAKGNRATGDQLRLIG